MQFDSLHQELGNSIEMIRALLSSFDFQRGCSFGIPTWIIPSTTFTG
jgi:hypothetical protein